MNLHFLRHVTMILSYSGVRILIDPMLSDIEAMDPVGNAGNDQRIPMVPLPVDNAALENLLSNLDGILVTHTHRDHWDKRAAESLRKDIPVLCQPVDEQVFKDAGFITVHPIHEQFDWQNIHFARTGGQHGTGDIGKLMGTVSGFVLSAPQEPTLYIAGDTIWCSEVEQAIERFKPQHIIVNTGAAQFLQGGPITMTEDDVVTVCRAAPKSQVIAVHMETVNHCFLRRAELQSRLEQEKLLTQVKIPADGEVIDLI